jgi:hypothetical protein
VNSKILFFSQIPFDNLQRANALGVRNSYRKLMGEAIRHRAHTESSRKLYEVLEFFKEEKERILSIINPKTGLTYDHYTWVSAFWTVCHEADTGRGGIVFNFFIDEICEELSAMASPYRRILVVAVHRVDEGQNGDMIAYNDTVVEVRFAQKPKMIALPKVKKTDRDGNIYWDWQRNSDGSVKKAPQYRTFVEYFADDGQWRTLGNIGSGYLPQVPETPADGSYTPVHEMKLYIIKEDYTHGNTATSQVLLLPDNVRTELGEAEVALAQRGIRRTASRIYWYIIWLHDSGYSGDDIKQLVPEWNHPFMLGWKKARGLKYPF